VLALIYLQAWSVLLCMHIYIRMLWGVNTAYGVKGCVSNTACVIIVTHVVTWFYANKGCKGARNRHVLSPLNQKPSSDALLSLCFQKPV